MRFVVDTNILLRFTNVNDVAHGLVREVVRDLIAVESELCYTHQNRREFWNVCTRPAVRNGLGYSIRETEERLAEVDSTFTRLAELSGAPAVWDRLVVQYSVQGVAVHDAQLVASMLAHAIGHLITLDEADFRRYASEITPVHPSDAVNLAGS